MGEPSTDITALLRAWKTDSNANERLMALVFEELRRIAHRQLRGERSDHTLQPTAVVHEAYLKLMGQHLEWKNRSHFFGVAAQLMRRILVDHARARNAEKREAPPWVLEPSAETPTVDVVALDVALERLTELDPVQAKVVELKYFGGLTNDEAAEALDVSPATIKRAWHAARAFLFQQLEGAP
jgi:RNA polymerase sigma factor (TIGR02999 family)